MPVELKRRALSAKQKSRHNFSLGEKGEEMAAQYLAARGFRILEKNYRTGMGRGGGEEIDLICLENEELVAVEIKTRASDYFGTPTLAINKTKIKQIEKATQSFMRQKGQFRQMDYRVDGVSVVIKEGQKPQIEHYRNISFML